MNTRVPLSNETGGGFHLLVRLSHLLDYSAVTAFESHLVPLHLTQTQCLHFPLRALAGTTQNHSHSLWSHEYVLFAKTPN